MQKADLYKPGDKMLDVYVVEQVLGAGGFSVVYLVRHELLPRKYAAKVMRTAADTPADLARLTSRVEREATVLARFDHPNVPTLHDLRIENGRPVLIIEHLVGRDLGGVLDRVDKLSIEDALYVGIEVAKPLYIAHQRDIVHRDIKPENVFCSAVQPPEGKAVVRLLDFGASRLLGQKGRITKEGMVVGTFHYTAPEVLRSGGESDPRADIYSLGIVLWEALAGSHPYDPEDDLSAHQVGLRQLEAPVPDIRNTRPGVPPRLADAISRMMAKHPGDRFPTMQDVYDELWATLSAFTHEAERVGRPLSSIFTRQGIQLPSPEIAPPSTKRRRRSRHAEPLEGPKTDEMALPNVAVAPWNRGAQPEAVPTTTRSGPPEHMSSRSGTQRMAPVTPTPMPIIAAPPVAAPELTQATVDVTTQEMVAVGALGRTAIGAPTIEERDEALLALQTRAPAAYRRVRLAMLVVELQRDLGFRVDDAGRVRCLALLETRAVDGLLLAVAARGLSVSGSDAVRIACAGVLERHGDRRHDGLLTRAMLEASLPALRTAIERALVAVRTRDAKPRIEVAPMPDEPLPLLALPDATVTDWDGRAGSPRMQAVIQVGIIAFAIVLVVVLAILGLR